jgi:hypothetical protein
MGPFLIGGGILSSSSGDLPPPSESKLGNRNDRESLLAGEKILKLKNPPGIENQ